jgi:quercetin dioxygenase-like cupin family protein
MEEMEYHIDNTLIPWAELGGGVRRKIVAHTPALMLVLVQFDCGAVGVVHQHDVHTQISHVLAGSFEVEVGGTKKILRTGDSFIAPPRTPHGVLALEDKSALADVFSPRRDDFLG